MSTRRWHGCAVAVISRYCTQTQNPTLGTYPAFVARENDTLGKKIPVDPRTTMSGVAVPISFLDEINDLMGESSSQGIIPTPSGMSCRLFDYQRFGLRFMVEREQQPHLGMLGGILADEQGLGKTVMCASLILDTAGICPPPAARAPAHLDGKATPPTARRQRPSI